MQIFLYWWGKEISLFELVHVYPFGELWSLCCIPHFDADLSIHGWWWKEAIAKGFQISQSAFCLADSVHPHKAMKGFWHPHVAIKRLQHPHVAVKGLQHPHVAVKGYSIHTWQWRGYSIHTWQWRGPALKQKTFIVIECWYLECQSKNNFLDSFAKQNALHDGFWCERLHFLGWMQQSNHTLFLVFTDLIKWLWISVFGGYFRQEMTVQGLVWPFSFKLLICREMSLSVNII